MSRKFIGFKTNEVVWDDGDAENGPCVHWERYTWLDRVKIAWSMKDDPDFDAVPLKKLGVRHALKSVLTDIWWAWEEDDPTEVPEWEEYFTPKE